MNLFDNEILFANLLQETLPLLFEQLTLTPILAVSHSVQKYCLK